MQLPNHDSLTFSCFQTALDVQLTSFVAEQLAETFSSMKKFEFLVLISSPLQLIKVPMTKSSHSGHEQ